MTLTELKAKYNLVRRAKYHDAPDMQVFRASTPKGQFLIDLDIDKNWLTGKKEYNVEVVNVEVVNVKKRQTFTSIDELDAFLAKANLGAVKDVVLPDEDIIKYICKQLSCRLKPTEFYQLTYIKWKNSIQLQDDGHCLPYNQFREGTGHQDDDINLGPIMMTLVDFEAWLIKMGVTKAKKPKAPSNRSLYD
jgi:hypothetical protein